MVGNLSLHVLLVGSSLQVLQIPFKFHLKSSCPFQEFFRCFLPKWTCGLQGDQTLCLCHVTQKHVLAGSSAAARALARGPERSSTLVAVLTVVSVLCCRTKIYKIWWWRVLQLTILLALGLLLGYSCPFTSDCFHYSYSKLMNFIMKNICPPENITYNKDLFSHHHTTPPPRLPFILSSCLRF